MILREYSKLWTLIAHRSIGKTKFTDSYIQLFPAGALYYFALAHQPDFDVRWCKGPIGQLIFTPLVEHLKALGVRVLGSRRVQDIVPAESQNPEYAQPNPKTLNRSATDRNWPGVVVARGPEGSTERYIADVFVLAAGLPALQRFVTQSRVLASAEDLRGVLGLRCSDVLAVRVWLDQQVELRSVSNVIVGCDDGVGGTFFHLNKLQVRELRWCCMALLLHRVGLKSTPLIGDLNVYVEDPCGIISNSMFGSRVALTWAGRWAY